jgi:SSS family solute:Na+ symporter
VWIIQTLPAIVIGLYTRWLHRWALVIGWAVGMIAGTAMAVSVGFGSVFPLSIGGLTVPGYSAFYAFLLNMLVSVVLTWVFNAASVAAGGDETAELDYTAAAA